MEINTENTEQVDIIDSGITHDVDFDSLNPMSKLLDEYENINIIEPYMLPDEVGGLVAEAFKIILGNPDVIVTLTAFSIFIALSLTTIEIYRKFR
ncbi:MAG TPA: hypothetical protein GX497_03395 [Bacillus bacterium]|nr:hypothetical protein [Bacillus sp. (in: firmicutes)]